ncbi:hypothetical protein WMY93_005737 [Mugilogobius chulae]|uniref:Uncharacterized protein n=1 Tax=Mugilogobius chulae TaxID=88201 RepID=A0AAW0PRJ2_9GOBI
MSKSQTLRALVSERLTAAAEEVFALFETTIAAYEEELQKQKTHNLLVTALSPRVLLCRTGVVSLSPDPGLNQDVPKTPQISEETEEQKKDQQQEPFSESREISESEQRPNVHREETQVEDNSWEFLLESDTEQHQGADSDEDWRAPVICSDSQMDTDSDQDSSSPVKTSTNNTTAQSNCASERSVIIVPRTDASLSKLLFDSYESAMTSTHTHSGKGPFYLLCSLWRRPCMIGNSSSGAKGETEQAQGTRRIDWDDDAWTLDVEPQPLSSSTSSTSSSWEEEDVESSHVCSLDYSHHLSRGPTARGLSKKMPERLDDLHHFGLLSGAPEPSIQQLQQQKDNHLNNDYFLLCKIVNKQ